MKIKKTVFLIILPFVCLGLLPNVQAVNPPPDGGYPGFNTAEGQNALFSLTTGAANTAVGWFSLFSDAEGSFNTATGVGALLFNTADNNTALGAAALLNNTDGSNNTAVGAAALLNNTTGSSHTAVGFQALQNNTAPCVLAPAGFGSNTAVGDNALRTNTCGAGNTAVGSFALVSNDTGNGNIAIGSAAGVNNTTGNNNTALGINAGLNVSTAGNVICIGTNVFGANVSDSCYIGNIHGATIDPATAAAVGVDNTGKLGTVASSRRFKHDIKPMDKDSEAILALKPVAFHYKGDAKNTPCFGLIAEEVAEVNPDLVVRKKSGEIWTVRYEQINAMLLNEFLKEHRKVEEQTGKMESQIRKIQEQEATITQLKKEMETVIAHSKEQDSQIQRVSAQLEMTKPVMQVTAENR